jgi:hypothetical protein
MTNPLDVRHLAHGIRRNPSKTTWSIAAAVAGVALLALPMTAVRAIAQQAPAATRPAELKRAEVTLAFFDALNQGDAAAAAAVFGENAFYSGASPQGLCSSSSPCYGHSNIRQAIDTLLKAPHTCETVTSLQVAGSFVTGRIEIRTDPLRANGIERIVTRFMTQTLDDKIAVFFNRSDPTDPETARNAAIASGTLLKGTPITVIPPCSANLKS